MAKSSDRRLNSSWQQRWLLALAFCGVVVTAAACYLVPISREREAIAALRAHGIIVETEARQPTWLWSRTGEEWETAKFATDPHSCCLGPCLPMPQITDDQLDLIGDLPQLEALYLIIPLVSEDGLQNIGHLRNLQTLSLTDLAFADDWIPRLRELENLRVLGIESRGLKDAPFIQAISHMKELESLRLNRVVFNDETVKILAGMPNLTELNLDEPVICQSGLDAIGQLSRVKFWSVLLHGANVNETDMVAITQMTSLNYLALYGTNIGDEGLKRVGRLKDLQKLVVYDNKVTSRGIAELERTLPDCEICFDFEKLADTHPIDALNVGEQIDAAEPCELWSCREVSPT